MVRRSANDSSLGPRTRGGRARKGLFGLLCACVLALGAFLGSGASAVAAEPCLNEALRAENDSLALPDCRAYELATPGFTGGFGVSGAPAYAYTDDESVTVQTFAGDIANSGSGAPGSRYVVTREGGTWHYLEDLNGPSRSPLAAPEDLRGSGAGPFEVSGDLRSSIWYMAKTTDSPYAIDFYLRRPDGHFELIGPYSGPIAPPGPPGNVLGGNSPLLKYLGASSDLTHLLIEGGGSSPYGNGLYEYVGTGNTAPERVDLDNSGEPVSSCGINEVLHNTQRNNLISVDGRVIYFMADACSGGPAAVELWARVDGSTSYQASQSLCTRTADPCNGPADAVFEGAAKDGSRAYFSTTQQLVNGDTNLTKDLYAYDLPTSSNPNPSPALTEVSGAGSEANVTGVVRVSDDGSTIYFIASGILAANTDAMGETAQVGDDNLYVWQRDSNHPAGETTFVGKLNEADQDIWGQETSRPRPAQTTDDGRYLVMAAFSQLVPTDTDTAKDVYRYDLATGEMVPLSTDESGTGGNTEGLDATISSLTYPEPLPSHRSRIAMTDDGASVVFETAEALSPADVNGATDVYMWEDGAVHLISTGSGIGAEFGKIDGSGRNIYFTTRDAITANDFDGVADVYTARVDGGFSFPETMPCAGDSCQPTPASAPSVAGHATDRHAATGNVATVRVAQLSASSLARLARGRKAQLKVTVDRPGQITLKGMAAISGKQRQVLSSAATVGQAGQVGVTLSLSQQSRRYLRTHTSLTVRLAVRFDDATPATMRLVLKRPNTATAHSRRRVK